MNKAFSAHMLVQEGDEQPQFVVVDVDLHPGQDFSWKEGEKVLVAGGFPSVITNSNFITSPTLQLNADLTSLEKNILEDVAQAELRREQVKQYRSYTVDADARLCVIGSSSETLNEFVDTFGGLLAIEPLLVNGSHPDYPVVTEMSLERGEVGGVSVEYAVRAPFEASKCTYCGACGKVCPEECIFPDLYFDFNLCTFCKKCEDVCPVDAVEIYGVEYRTTRFPAVVVLDGCKVDGADRCSSVYNEENISDYLKTLYPFQVDEIISIDNEFCQHNSDLGKGCTACLQACRYGAMSLKGGVAIDPLRCEECGDCVASCPTGTLQYERFSDQTFVDYFGNFDVKGKTVVLGSVDLLHDFWWKNRSETYGNSFFVSLENVNFLNIFQLFYLYSQGVGKIVIVKDEDDSGKALAREAKLAGVMLKALFEGDVPIVLTDKLDTELLAGAENPLSGKYLDTTWLNRRAALANTLQFICEKSDKTPGFKGNEQTAFATIRCDDKRCTQCMSCINSCKVRAMSADETELILSHRGVLCVGCGLCVQVCPENALQLTDAWQFTPQFFEPGLLAAGEPMNCVGCGKVFGTRKSYERVMSILAAKESVDTSHFEYCETCRITRLFDE